VARSLPFLSLISLLAVLGSALAVSAADANACQGPRATPGTVVRGPVLEIPDGSSLCVALGVSRSTWVPINVAHLGADRAMLMAVAFGRNATCVVGADGRGQCRIEGAALADGLRDPEARKIATSWR
jgi:hypothetical protein